jgi:hypothetical protein
MVGGGWPVASQGQYWWMSTGYDKTAVQAVAGNRFTTNPFNLPEVVGYGVPVYGTLTPLFQGNAPSVDPKYLVASADIDGDGVYDQIFTQTKPLTSISDGTVMSVSPVGTSVFFTAGENATNSTSLSVPYSNYGSILSSLTNCAPSSGFWVPWGNDLQPGRFALADLNGDGLVDVVAGELWGGVPLINTGSTWNDGGGFFQGQSGYCPTTASGSASWTVPSLSTGFLDDDHGLNQPIPEDLSTYPLDAFVDVNGDGIADRVQSFLWCPLDTSSPCINPGGVGKLGGGQATYINNYHPPVITGFPNGIAAQTVVQYDNITDNSVGSAYSDSALGTLLPPDMMRYGTPLQVVQSVSSDSGVYVGSGSSGHEVMGTTTYSYTSLRMSMVGHGPLGFATVTSTDPTGLMTKTTYSQTYPFVGKPTSVVRSRPNDGLTVESTNTTYGVSYAQAATTGSITPVFVYPSTITDVNYLYSSPTSPSGGGAPAYSPAGQITTTTTNSYDGKHGNLLSTTVFTTSATDSRLVLPRFGGHPPSGERA